MRSRSIVCDLLQQLQPHNYMPFKPTLGRWGNVCNSYLVDALRGQRSSRRKDFYPQLLVDLNQGKELGVRLHEDPNAVLRHILALQLVHERAWDVELDHMLR